jgi:hypothetical protein
VKTRTIRVGVLLIALTLPCVAQTVVASSPEASYRVSAEKGIITVADAKSGTAVASTTLERWGVTAPTQDKLRHVALDVTAAAVAGKGGREHTVGPNSPVYTMADFKKNKASYVTMTVEKGIGFVLLSDTYVNGHYEALIYMGTSGEWHIGEPP